MSTTPESAFPSPHNVYANGMSLRDYFAAKAMQAAITGLVSRNRLSNICQVEVADFSQKMATAMLKARQT